MEWWQTAGLALVGGLFVQKVLKGREEKQAALRGLQFWYSEDEEWRVHFPSMLLLELSGTSPVFNVRRRSDGIWERIITSDSQDITLETLRAEMEGSPNSVTASHLRHYEEAGDWHPMGWASPTLETAYQRFIHAQGVPIEPVQELKERWLSIGAKKAEREKASKD